MATDPLTLRLPRWLCQSFDLARAIANEHRVVGRTTAICQFDRFDMRTHERAFVKTVLARRSNLWLFRTNQRRSCGDFIAIDMSSSRRADRRAYVMELKMGGRLVIGGGHLQVAQYPSAISELVAREILDAGSPIEVLHGDGDAVLMHL
ncbi:MAG TPA: hypothetical protein VGM90_13805 [Kofleriaceae bacterium]|jgi:hypothetical protein